MGKRQHIAAIGALIVLALFAVSTAEAQEGTFSLTIEAAERVPSSEAATVHYGAATEDGGFEEDSLECPLLTACEIPVSEVVRVTRTGFAEQTVDQPLISDGALIRVSLQPEGGAPAFRGRVLPADVGGPVSGTIVRLRGRDHQAGISDEVTVESDGSFEFAGTLADGSARPAGLYSVTATRVADDGATELVNLEQVDLIGDTQLVIRLVSLREMPEVERKSCSSARGGTTPMAVVLAGFAVLGMGRGRRR